MHGVNDRSQRKRHTSSPETCARALRDRHAIYNAQGARCGHGGLWCNKLISESIPLHIFARMRRIFLFLHELCIKCTLLVLDAKNPKICIEILFLSLVNPAIELRTKIIKYKVNASWETSGVITQSRSRREHTERPDGGFPSSFVPVSHIAH